MNEIRFTEPNTASAFLSFHNGLLLNVTANLLALFRLLEGIRAFVGGRPGGESGPFGGEQGAIGDSIDERVDIDTYFCWHEHDLCSVAILRALL